MVISSFSALSYSFESDEPPVERIKVSGQRLMSPPNNFASFYRGSLFYIEDSSGGGWANASLMDPYQKYMVKSHCSGHGDQQAAPCREYVKDSKVDVQRTCRISTSANLAIGKIKDSLEKIGEKIDKNVAELIDLVNEFDVATDHDTCVDAFANLFNTADKGCNAIDENATKACIASEGKNIPGKNS